MLFVVSMVLFVVTTDTDESFALILSCDHVVNIVEEPLQGYGVGGTAGGVGGVLSAVASHSDPVQHSVTMSDIVRSNSSKSTVDTLVTSTKKFIK